MAISYLPPMSNYDTLADYCEHVIVPAMRANLIVSCNIMPREFYPDDDAYVEAVRSMTSSRGPGLIVGIVIVGLIILTIYFVSMLPPGGF